MQAYVFRDYWEDIGTIKSFYDANLALTDEVDPFVVVSYTVIRPRQNFVCINPELGFIDHN